MRCIRAIATLAGAAAIIMSAGWSAGAAEPDASGTLVLERESGSVGLGTESGKGELTLKDGSVYAVTMEAYSLLGLGFANISSTGKVFNLEKASDLAGEYTGTGMSAALGPGTGKSTLKNKANGVRIEMSSKLSGIIADIGLASVVLKVGERLKAPNAPPPVVAAPAPPIVKAAVVPPVKPVMTPAAVTKDKPTRYTVHFGFNKSRVSLANTGVLDSVLADWKEKGATFRVVGHADMVGSARYNMRLSRKRADAVKKILIQKGVPASRIVAVGVGQQDLAVKTKRGKRLRENRRVTLMVIPPK